MDKTREQFQVLIDRVSSLENSNQMLRSKQKQIDVQNQILFDNISNMENTKNEIEAKLA